MSTTAVASGDIFAFEIPRELIYPVPLRFRERATVLLGGSDITALSTQECQSLSCPIDANPALSRAIDKIAEKLDIYLHNPFVPERSTLPISDDSKRRILEQQQRMISLWRGEIGRLEKWREKLHPFLVKAVALNESTFSRFIDPPVHGFSARLYKDALVIHHGCSGDYRVPMQNVPVVVFLEHRPVRVYQTVSMMDTSGSSTEATVEPSAQ